MSELPVRYVRSLSLDDLSASIGGDEAALGTLLAIAAGAMDNYAIFKRGKSPDPSARLVVGTQAPDGTTALCAGKLWILKALLDVVAVRDKT